MNAEIERKFLIDISRLPFHLEDFPFKEIEQCYLLWNDMGEEARIRKIDNQYKFTFKKGEGVARKEAEIDITATQYELLRPVTEGRRLKKRRYYIKEEEYLIEMDVYYGKASGLVVAEIEFKSSDDFYKFKPPAWFGKEISRVDAYRNRNLAVE